MSKLECLNIRFNSVYLLSILIGLGCSGSLSSFVPQNAIVNLKKVFM